MPLATKPARLLPAALQGGGGQGTAALPIIAWLCHHPSVGSTVMWEVGDTGGSPGSGSMARRCRFSITLRHRCLGAFCTCLSSSRAGTGHLDVTDGLELSSIAVWNRTFQLYLGFF